jgi:hypothetical protein
MSCSHLGEPCEHNFSESLHRVITNLPSLQLSLLFVHQQYSICVYHLSLHNLPRFFVTFLAQHSECRSKSYLVFYLYTTNRSTSNVDTVYFTCSKLPSMMPYHVCHKFWRYEPYGCQKSSSCSSTLYTICLAFFAKHHSDTVPAKLKYLVTCTKIN